MWMVGAEESGTEDKPIYEDFDVRTMTFKGSARRKGSCVDRYYYNASQSKSMRE